MARHTLLAVLLWGVAVPGVTLGQSSPDTPRLQLQLPSLPVPVSAATFRVNVTAPPERETVLDATRQNLASKPQPGLLLPH